MERNSVDQQRTPVRYGPALVHFRHGRPLRHLSAAIFVPVNGQGIMGAGLAGEVRIEAGAEVEIELRRHAPLTVGASYLTGPGKLAAQSVEHLVHGVVVAQPGETPRRGDPERTLEDGLALIETTTARSITIPLVNHRARERSPGANAATLAGILAAHLRRGSRLREITVAGLDSVYLQAAHDALVNLGGLPE